MAYIARAYPSLCTMKELGVFSALPWTGCQRNQGLPSSSSSISQLPIKTPGWRETRVYVLNPNPA